MKITRAISLGIVASAMTLSSIMAASAAPITVAEPNVTGFVDQVQWRPHHDRAPPRHSARPAWGPDHGRPRPGYYHGYRGYHDRRPGYRRHSDGLWYPAAAFALGAIIGGAMNN